MLQRKEITTLLVNLISAKMLLTFPRIVIENSGNSAWLEIIFNTVMAALLFLVTVTLYRGKKNIIQLAEMSGGKGLKIFIGIFVFTVLIINFASIIRIFPETVKIVLLQDFRVEVIIGAFVVAIALGAYIGIEPLAKINNIFMVIAGAVFLAFVLLLLPYYNIDNLLPIFGNGFGGIFFRGLNTLSLFSDILILNILLPYCENYSEAKKSGWRAIYLSAAISLIIILAYCLIYPYPESKEFMIPVYQLARVIYLSSFFSRFEAIFQFVWSLVLFLYAAIYVYVLCYVWQITFGLKYYRPLIFPVVIISGVIALLPSSLIDLVSVEEWENIAVYPISFLLPIIFGLVSRKYYGGKKIGKEKDGDELSE